MDGTCSLHPGADELRAFGQGRLGPTEVSAIEQHLAACAACCQLLDEAPADTFLDRLRQTRQHSTRTPDGPAATTLGGPTPAPADLIPTELAGHPRYRIVRLLGQGGMGAVYLAEHTVMDRPVALKVINPALLDHPGALPRFRREVQAAARLAHPNIVTAYDADEAGGLHFLVMEYVEGQTLAELLAERGPLPVAQACGYMRQAALGLQHAHERGMVHRDIKPHNLMLTPSGRVQILDFGLARFAAEPARTMDGAAPGPVHLTDFGALMGTADYIAPEQARDARGADIRADIYALGCTLYHLLTGQPPFPDGSTMEKINRHASAEPVPLQSLRPGLPTGFAAVVARLMAKRPEARYPTPAAVAEALRPFACPPRAVEVNPFADIDLDEPAAALAVPPPTRPRSRRALVIALLAILALAAAAVVIRLKDGREVAIETNDPTVEVVVKGDRIVRIVDPTTGKAYQLDRQDLTIGLADGPDGLQVALDNKPVVLRRRGQQIATVRLMPRGSGTGEEPAEIAGPSRARRVFPAAPNTRFPLFHPDGRHLLYPDGGNVAVRDIQTGQKVRTLVGPGERIMVVQLTTDARTVVALSADRQVTGWDWATSRKVAGFTVPEIWGTIAMTPLPGRNAIAVQGRPGFVSIRGWPKGEEQVRIDLGEPAEWVFGLAASPDGKRLAIVGSWGRTWVYDLAAGKIEAVLPAFAAPGRDFSAGAFSRDGKAFAVGSAGGLRVWEVSKWQLPPVTARTDASGLVAFDPSGETVTTSSVKPMGGRAVFARWDRQTGRGLTALPVALNQEWNHALLAPDGRTLAVDDRSLGGFALHDTTLGLKLAVFGGEAPADRADEVRRFAEGTTPSGMSDWVWRVAFSADGRKVLASHGDSTVLVWDRATGKQQAAHPQCGGSPFHVTDGGRLYSAFERVGDNWVPGLYEVETAKRIAAYPEGASPGCWWAALSEDGSRLALCQLGSTIQLLDGNTGKTIRTLDGGFRPARCAVFSPDGKLLAAAGNHPEGLIRIWDIETGREVGQLTHGGQGCIWLSFTPDGKGLISMGGIEVCHWDLAGRKEFRRLRGHAGPLEHGALSADGRFLASASGDGTVRWWDLDRGRELHCFRGHPAGVLGVAISPDGRELVSSCKGGAVILWRLPEPPPERLPTPREAWMSRESTGFGWGFPACHRRSVAGRKCVRWTMNRVMTTCGQGRGQVAMT